MNLHLMPRRALGTITMLLAVSFLASGCLYLPAVYRNVAEGTSSWWCEGGSGITATECGAFSATMDVVIPWAYQYPTPADAAAGGGTTAHPVSVGEATVYKMRPGTSFSAGAPQYLLYDGNQLAGAAYYAESSSEPAGFAGDRDHWTRIGSSDAWVLPVWVIRPYENQPDVFAAVHPCLEPGVDLTTTTDDCYIASHPEALDILVTNDDGVGAPGIDALVEALRLVPGVRVTVVAPATNQSGVGDTTTPGGAPGSPSTTASGRSAIAVAGTPADSVIYALNVAHVTPDLVLSGINLGQNMGPIIPVSGTVGAARTAVRRGVPAIATSQGAATGNATVDFPSGATATINLLEDWRLGRAGDPFMVVPNLNIPSCQPGSSIRGRVTVPVATSLVGRNYFLQDCTSTVTLITDDVDALNNGFIALSDARKG